MYTNNTQSKSKNNSSGREQIVRAGDKIVHDLHDLKKDARNLKEDIKGAAHTVSDVACQAGAQVRDVAKTTIHTPAAILSNVRDHPVKSAFIALAAGFIIGKIYR